MSKTTINMGNCYNCVAAAVERERERERDPHQLTMSPRVKLCTENMLNNCGNFLNVFIYFYTHTHTHRAVSIYVYIAIYLRFLLPVAENKHAKLFNIFRPLQMQ